MFLRVVVRASTKSLVVIVMVEPESLSIESQELTESRRGVEHLVITGLLGVFRLSVGVEVWCGLDGECPGEEIGVPFGVLTGDGHGVSSGTRFDVDGCLGEQ